MSDVSVTASDAIYDTRVVLKTVVDLYEDRRVIDGPFLAAVFVTLTVMT